MKMKAEDLSLLLLLAFLLASPARAFLFPLLFPVSIRITLTSHHKPPPPVEPVYHFQKVPVYKEVVKGSSYPHKHSYGDGHEVGTSYGDGHHKVYTHDPHVHDHKYAAGYSPPAPSGHIKGSIHISVPSTHIEGTAHIGPAPDPHYKGTEYGSVKYPDPHYKGTEYGSIKYPDPHHKGTEYVKFPDTHYDAPETHYKGTSYEESPKHGKHYGYIKPVGGHPGYKISDYVTPDSHPEIIYEQDKGTGYEPAVAIPGNTYSEIEAAHHSSIYNTGGPKAYAAKEYADLGSPYKAVQYADDENTQYKYVDRPEYVVEGSKYKEYGSTGGVKGAEHEATLLDDTLPAYKVVVHPGQFSDRSGYRKKSGRVGSLKDSATEPTTYAGYGTSVYGDSYAKISYEPKKSKAAISRRN